MTMKDTSSCGDFRFRYTQIAPEYHIVLNFRTAIEVTLNYEGELLFGRLGRQEIKRWVDRTLGIGKCILVITWC